MPPISVEICPSFSWSVLVCWSAGFSFVFRKCSIVVSDLFGRPSGP